MLEPLLLVRLVWLLICIAGLTEHHAAWSMLSKKQVQERTNEWNGPDDHQPENGSDQRMVILKDHECLDNMTYDRQEYNYQKQ
jgi:hypothetical protein